MERFSRKRQSILACLRSTKTHPTAEWIYERLKPVYPELSVATVYRNLRELREEGLIRMVATVDGRERYDACVAPHVHAICRCCGRVLDVDGIGVPTELSADARRITGFEIEGAELNFSGICSECREKENGR